jgi:hypothetical protein
MRCHFGGCHDFVKKVHADSSEGGGLASKVFAFNHQPEPPRHRA